MIQSITILNALPKALQTIDLPELGEKNQGKVRDFYLLPDKRITITTDRQSAFDVILGQIPFKGAVLNQLAAFWFEKTTHIIPNHMIAIPDPNVLVSKNCQPIPVEMVVRGYLSGVTKTSIWYSYKKGERKIYGIHFPDGMKKNQKLPHPIITPTTHPLPGSTKHDERLTRDEIIKQKIVDPKIYKQMEEASLALFDFGSKWCKKHGLILVDTKYEFGIYDGKLMLMDEIHTPDSSRFWIAKTYIERIKQGKEPENFDKEFIRLWYTKKVNPYKDKIPPMSEELIIQAAKRYIKTYEMLTEKKFQAFKYPIEERIKKNLKPYFNFSILKNRKRLLSKQINIGKIKRISLNEKMKTIGIVQRGDPLLENVCKSFLLPSQKDIAQSVITQLQQTIKIAQQIHDFSKGLGLAAPQIGLAWQAAIVMPLEEKPLILLNPKIISQSREMDKKYEGCWSFFDVRGLVPRPLKIEIAYLTLDGKEIHESFSHGIARLILHELDHLQGILYPSRMEKRQKLLSYEEYKEKSQPWQYLKK